MFLKHLKNVAFYGLFAVACAACEDKPVVETVTPTLTINDLEVKETGDTKSTFLDLRLSSASTETVTVVLSTVDGTAVAGEDFKALNGTVVTIAPGSFTKAITLDILGDDAEESDETFQVVVDEVTGANFSKTPVTVTILNDDFARENIEIPTEGYTTPIEYSDRELVWNDEFDASNLAEHWTFEFGANGWGNEELQYYTDQNAFTHEGNLVIEAREEAFEGAPYTSSRIITEDNFEFKFGRVDIRAVLPKGQGIWPALWMLGANFREVSWPDCGEIDIMEIIGNEPSRLHGTVHWSNNGEYASYGGDTELDSGTFSDQFHVFSILWEENAIIWMLDDKIFHSINTGSSDMSEFRERFFFIFNVAVGGRWPGYPDDTTVFPQRMIVDYIRVFQ